MECSQVGTRLVVMEIPLIFEAGWEDLVDEIWAVYTRPKLQLQRLMSRDKLTEKQALARINAQMSSEEMCRRADVCIFNVGGYAEIRRRVTKAIRGRTF